MLRIGLMREFSFARRGALFGLLVLIASAVPAPAFEQAAVLAQGYPADGCLARREAKATVLSGGAVRLRSVVGVAEQAANGEMINAELCRQGGQLVYVITVLSTNGKVVYVTLNANSGQLIGTR